MPRLKCGYHDEPDKGVKGHVLLSTSGPSMFVNIGFDSQYNPAVKGTVPVPSITDAWALIDTGASECCIDSQLAIKLGLPIIDRRRVAGVGGQHEVNMHLAQIHVPALNVTMYGAFAGVELTAGGQKHQALMGRTFLTHFTMIYSGPSGDVELFS